MGKKKAQEFAKHITSTRYIIKKKKLYGRLLHLGHVWLQLNLMGQNYNDIMFSAKKLSQGR